MSDNKPNLSGAHRGLLHFLTDVAPSVPNYNPTPIKNDFHIEVVETSDAEQYPSYARVSVQTHVLGKLLLQRLQKSDYFLKVEESDILGSLRLIVHFKPHFSNEECKSEIERCRQHI